MPFDASFKKRPRKERSNKTYEKQVVDIETYFTSHKINASAIEKDVIDILATVSKNIDLIVIECPICYEEYPKHSMVQTGQCKHMFCASCTEKLCGGRHSAFSCPLCRSKVTSIAKRDNWQVPCTTIPLKARTQNLGFRLRLLLMLMNVIAPENESSYRQLIELWHDL